MTDGSVGGVGGVGGSVIVSRSDISDGVSDGVPEGLLDVEALAPRMVMTEGRGSGDMSGVSSGASSPTLVLQNMQLMTPRASPLPLNYAAAANAALVVAASANPTTTALIFGEEGRGGERGVVSPSSSSARIAFTFDSSAVASEFDASSTCDYWSFFS